MNVEQIAAKITTLLEEVHADGVKKGRDLEYTEGIQTVIQALEKRRQPVVRTRTRSRTPKLTPAPTPVEAPGPTPDFANGVRALVAEALDTLAPEHADGIYPDAIADHTHIKVREVRSALRHLTLTGTARRMARGKYLPATPLLNLQPAAQ